MTINPQAITIRSKILGVLIRDSRLSHNKTIGECAAVIGVTPGLFEEYEFGNDSPSLPELELLAYYLNIPFENFKGASILSEPKSSINKVDSKQMIGIRQRMIGAQIRKTRLSSNITSETLAEQVGIPSDKLESFEMGEQPIPYPLLEALTTSLGGSIQDFQDQHSQVGEWFTRQNLIKNYLSLPTDLQTFVVKPVNQPYLEIAKRLSEMPVDRLRAVGELLLEITL